MSAPGLSEEARGVYRKMVNETRAYIDQLCSHLKAINEYAPPTGDSDELDLLRDTICILQKAIGHEMHIDARHRADERTKEQDHG